MELVKVRGQWTLEEREKITLSEPYIDELSRIPSRDDEKDYYASIENDLDTIVKGTEDPWSRKLVSTNDECITAVQLLALREHPTILVFMRSSDAARLASDIGFLCRLAKKYKADRVEITISSFHVILKDAEEQ